MKMMKSVCFLAALMFVADANIIFPEKLFQDAIKTQTEISDKQKEIFESISGLRLKLADVLKKTANNTLQDIEGDVTEVLKIDQDLRKVIFETHTRTTPCMINLRTRLDLTTEFTGFQSGLCIATYERAVSAVNEEAYKVVGIYDGELSEFELSVIASFTFHNVWSQPDDIRKQFEDSLADFLKVAQNLDDKIGDLVLGVEEQVEALRKTLNSCYANNHQELTENVNRLETYVDTCNAFDNGR